MQSWIVNARTTSYHEKDISWILTERVIFYIWSHHNFITFSGKYTHITGTPRLWKLGSTSSLTVLTWPWEDTMLIQSETFITELNRLTIYQHNTHRLSEEEFLRIAEVNVAAINAATDGLPQEKVIFIPQTRPMPKTPLNTSFCYCYCSVIAIIVVILLIIIIVIVIVIIIIIIIIFIIVNIIIMV